MKDFYNAVVVYSERLKQVRFLRGVFERRRSILKVDCKVYMCVNNLDGKCEGFEIEIDERGKCEYLDTDKKHEPTPDKIHGMVE